MTVTIELEIDTEHSNESNEEAIKEAVYQYLMELIDDDSLEFAIEK